MLDFSFLLIFILFLLLSLYRGFIREFFSLLGMCFSILCTTFSYNKLSNILVSYIHSEILSDIISIILVYLVFMLISIYCNSKIYKLLSSIIRHPVDRFSGIFIGFLKSYIISFIIFSGIHLVCMIYYLPPTEEVDKKVIISDEEYIPSWITSSVTYTVYAYTKKRFDLYLARNFYSNIQDTVKR